jgi:voltage-gated potassium channel
MVDSGRHAFRRRVAHVLEAGIGHETIATVVNVGLVVLIVANVLAFAAGTVPDIQARYGWALTVFERASVHLFAIEYALRVWSAVELPLLRGEPPWRARLHHATRPMQIIDLMSFLPSLLEPFVPFDLDAFRVLRLLRFLRIARYSAAMQSLGHVLAAERSALLGALVIMLTVMFFAATGIYLLERDVQPKAFGTVPDAMWWAVVTLATVGYGDTVPVTALGKVWGALVIFAGLCVFALPIGIIATGFAQEIQKRNFVVTWALVSRVPIFAGLDAASAAQIMTLLKSEIYEEGDAIVHKGDPGSSMYFVATGSAIVELETGDVQLGEGDFFGEMALLDRKPRSHTVVAGSNRTRVLVLDRDDFERLGRRMPDVVRRIREVAEARRAASPPQS